MKIIIAIAKNTVENLELYSEISINKYLKLIANASTIITMRTLPSSFGLNIILQEICFL